MAALTVLDPDTRRVVESLHSALAKSRLSQERFARCLGTSPARFSTYRSGRVAPSAAFVFRAERIASALNAAWEHRMMSSAETALAVAAKKTTPDKWRMLLQGRDHLRLGLSADSNLSPVAESWEAVPPSTGGAGFDILLAALAKQEFEAAGATPPEWCFVDPLPEPWIPEHPFLSAHDVITRTPAFLRNLNVFVPARDLVTS